MKSVTHILALAVERGASDVHLFCGLKPRFRIHGDLVWLDDMPEVNEDLMDLVMNEVLTEKQRQQFEETWELDTGFSVPGLGRYRGNFLRESKGPGCVFRLVPTGVPSLDQIGMPPVVRELAMLNQGLVLVTGPTGSGKSTTLAAMVSLINETKPIHIITIEDPIEFVHPSIQATVTQREVGKDTKHFLVALRAALREDPDVILVGELRDAETMSMALRATETGHLVFSTLHTTSAVGTINRFVETFPADSHDQVRLQLSESLKGVIAQRLLSRSDVQGRISCVEIMLMTPAVAALIREAKTFQINSLIQTGRKQGMQLFDSELLQLYEDGVISEETAYESAMNKQAFYEGMKKIQQGGKRGQGRPPVQKRRPAFKGDQTGTSKRPPARAPQGGVPAAKTDPAAKDDDGFTLGQAARGGSWLFSEEDGQNPLAGLDQEEAAPTVSPVGPSRGPESMEQVSPEPRRAPPPPEPMESPRGDTGQHETYNRPPPRSAPPPSGPAPGGPPGAPPQRPPRQGPPPSGGGISFRKPTLGRPPPPPQRPRPEE